jgi:hypothetical protein
MMIGHCGWGEVLFVRMSAVGAAPRLFRVLYRIAGSDMDFDPEFPPLDDPTRIRAT